MTSSVRRVPRRPAGPNYKPLTWGNAVSEGGPTPYPHIAL